LSKAASVITQQTRATAAAHSIVHNQPSTSTVVHGGRNGYFESRDRRKSVNNRSIVTKQSKRMSFDETNKQNQIKLSNSASDGYIEFARRIDNIERGIAIAYFSQCALRLFLESTFLYIQYRIFNFNVPELYKCHRWPCPNTVSLLFYCD